MFLSLIGTIWGLAITVFVGNNLVSIWPNNPGRFLTTVSENRMTLPLISAAISLLMGLLIMGIEYFRENK